MIGACCPSSNLIIIIYIAPNTLAGFGTAFSYALSTTITVNGVGRKPSILSCSWGAPETYFSNLSSINSIFAGAVSSGVNITTATGDYGSNDGVGGSGAYCDFPSSSPNVIACGGTTLVCPAYTYSDPATVETVWSGGGGGVSRTFLKPSYQSAITGTYRNTPDLSLDSDPNTGVSFIVNGQTVIYGGTSVASPAVAGYLACLRPSAFVNPNLYLAGQPCFHDIKVGSNGAFRAGVGYDNCSGFGSINGSVLSSPLLGNFSVIGVTLNASSVLLAVGNTFQASATIAPASAVIQTVSYASSNVAVATVTTPGGLITATGNGTCTVTVTTTDGGFTASIAVSVQVLVASVSLNLTAVTLIPGQTQTLSATVLPSNATDKSVTWTSSNTAAATVNGSGVVTAVANGTARITCTTTSGAKIATCTVTVSTPVTSISLIPSTTTVAVRGTVRLTATVLPSTASNKAVTWTSSNTAIATVNSLGQVNGRRSGVTTITVKSTSIPSILATCLVTVA
jgi:uncharacterized protein YjdB